MATLEQLEKRVQELQKQLKNESEKTSALEKEVKDLTKEVSTLKGDSAPNATSPKSAAKTESSTNNGATKTAETSAKKGDSDNSSSSDDSDSSDEGATAPVVKPTESSESDGSILKAGFLEKKGAVRHNWLRRWFQLDSKNKYLCYYDRKGVSKGVWFL
jgi:hypothetical protein